MHLGPVVFVHEYRFRRLGRMRISTMRFSIKSAIACVAVVGILLVTAPTYAQERNGIEKPADTPVDGNIEWVFDYDQAKLLAHSSGKPMFVVFRCER